jgi:hypothetical protein
VPVELLNQETERELRSFVTLAFQRTFDPNQIAVAQVCLLAKNIATHNKIVNAQIENMTVLALDF